MAPKDPYKYFRVEARELLDELSKLLRQAKSSGPSAEAVGGMLRHAHTLKGAARVVRLGGLADQAHALEELLEPLRKGAATLGREAGEALGALLDGMRAGLEGLDQAAPAPSAGPLPTGAPVAERRLETLRLETSDLDGVLEGLREAAGQLEELKRDFPMSERLERAAAELSQAQGRAERLRLLPASALFEFLEQACREAAGAQGKQLRMEFIGAMQRVEAQLLRGLQEGLLHVVRNAVIHGLEDTAGRAAAGKPRQGLLRLELRRRRGRLTFVCEDDGRGVDPARVRRAAQAAGRLPDGAPDPMGMPQALELLLRGGLSTSAKVDGLSGRGLGLDVLRETAARLKGGVRLHSETGKGMRVEVELASALGSFQALAVEAAGAPALIPLESVLKTLRLRPEQLAMGSEGELLALEGGSVPYLPLASLFEGAAPSPPANGVLLRASGATLAMGVERVLGLREAVVMPLPEAAPDSDMVSGASLDASGRPCLVLDPEGLLRAYSRPRPGAGASMAAERLPLLVVDDSLTTRMLEQNILETAGYAVETASSAEEGLEMARRRRFGLILVDVEMPGMDGFQFLEHLGADPQLSGIPALMVSSRADPEDKLRAQRCGARDYVVKGEFDQARLLGRIRELLE